MPSRLRDYAAAGGDAIGTFLAEMRKSAQVAELEAKRAQAKRPQPKALFSNPLAEYQAGSYREPATGLSFAAIRQAVEMMPVLAVIIMVRTNQVSAFAKPAETDYDVGFKIVQRDKKAQPTDASRAEADRLTRIFERCGVPEGASMRDNLGTFLAKGTEDVLTFSQATTEVVPDYLGQPAAWSCVDASTMRLAAEHRDNRFAEDEEDIRYVQVVNGMAAAGFTQDEMIFSIMNPTSDIMHHGYGVSPVEKVSRAVASLIQAFDHNSRVFEQGANVRGILNFAGMTDKALQRMRRTWDQWVRGPSNAHTMPLTNCETAPQLIAINQTNQQAGYTDWSDYLIKLACGIFLISPEEINMSYGVIGQTQSLTQPSNRDKLLESKERGLTPLLRLHEGTLNKILRRLNPDYEFRFVGLNAMTRAEREDYDNKRVRTTHTIDELRKERELPELENGWGKVILDPNFLTNKFQSAAMGIQAGAPALNAGRFPGEQTFDYGGNATDVASEDVPKVGTPEMMLRSMGPRSLGRPQDFARWYARV